MSGANRAGLERLVQSAAVAAAAAGAGSSPAGSGVITGGGCDPFTGAAAGRSSSSSAVQQQQQAPGDGLAVPLGGTYFIFDNLPPAEALRKKLLDFSAQLAASPATAPMALTASEVAAGGRLERLLNTVLPAALSSGGSAAAALSGDDVSMLRRLLTWPPQHLFPVLDIVRVLLLSSTVVASVPRDMAGSCTPASAAGQPGTVGAALAAATEPPAVSSAMQTSLRLLCNCFATDAMRSWALGNRAAILERCAAAAGSGIKAEHTGLAALAANYAIALRAAQAPGGGGSVGCSAADASDGKLQLLAILANLLQAMPLVELNEPGGCRAMAAVGTLVFEDSRLRAAARELGLPDVVHRISGQAGASDKLRSLVEQALAAM